METMKVVLQVPPTLVIEMDRTSKKDKEIKFGKAYDMHLMKVNRSDQDAWNTQEHDFPA